MEKLTERQQKVLEFIRDSIQQQGFPPTLREIGNQLGIRSTNGVNDHLRALERKGFLTRMDMKSRTLKLTPAAFPRPTLADISGLADIVEIPILGRVAAGQPLEAIENVEDTVHIDRMMIDGAREIFGLRVRGDSMIEAGIHDGDYVFVRKQIEANRGAIIVALVGDEATCKYYYPERDHVRLEPANSQMAPILIHKNEWRSTRILGVVVGVYRKLTNARG
ncbi:MAG: transcriptional repressor LexA [Myxococcales bacterium]|nr:transcriptional repressor LexA [Myxococcales bacterium]MCB9708315.1 transcriptional repressor LexA [Myxococcales bacterium]